MGRLGSTVAFATAVFWPALALPSPCEGDEVFEHIEILEDGFLRWCEGPDGPTTPKRRHDRAGQPVRPKPPPPPPPLELPGRPGPEVEVEVVVDGPRARPFSFSNRGPGRSQFVTALGLRFFPTLTESPVPALDFTTTYAVIDALKLDLRLSLGGLVNTADLSSSTRFLDTTHFSAAVRIGLSTFTEFNEVWNVGVGPRTGLGLSFGDEEAQITTAMEVVAYLAGAGQDSPDRPRNPAAWRAQLAGEFDLSPTGTVTDRASLFIELALERRLVPGPGLSMPVIFSTSIGVVY